MSPINVLMSINIIQDIPHNHKRSPLFADCVLSYDPQEHAVLAEVPVVRQVIEAGKGRLVPMRDVDHESPTLSDCADISTTSIHPDSLKDAIMSGCIPSWMYRLMVCHAQ